MRIFQRRRVTAANDGSSPAPGGAGAASPPLRPPRTRAHSETVRRYREEYELARREEMDKLEELGHAPQVARSGSVLIRLDTALLQSQKQYRGSAASRTIAQPKELSEVLSNPALRNLFRTFLKLKFASESIMFFETIELFNTVSGAEWRTQVAIGIMERFVLDGAELCVNISARDRGELLARFKTQFWPEHSFDGAMREVYDLMNLNFFHAFVVAFAPWPLNLDLAAERETMARRRTTLKNPAFFEAAAVSGDQVSN